MPAHNTHNYEANCTNAGILMAPGQGKQIESVLRWCEPGIFHTNRRTARL